MPDFSMPRRTPFRRRQMKLNEIAYIQSRPEPERTLLKLRLKPYKGRGKNHNYPFIKRAETGCVQVGNRLYDPSWYVNRKVA